MFSRHRIEALSDGIFAIAMTLLVLDIKVPLERDPAGGLGHALLHLTPEWVSFIVSFALASLFWTFQHRVLDAVEEFGPGSLVLTFVALGFVSVLPFSTSLWGHHITKPLAFMFYFLNQACIAGALALKLELARSSGHLRAGHQTSAIRVRLWFLFGLMTYAAIASRIVPILYFWAAILPVALIGRYLRHRLKLAAQNQPPAAAITSATD